MNRSAQLQQDNQRLRTENDQLRTENQLLRQKLDALAQRMFGRKSEQLNPAQLELLLAGVIESVGEPESEQQDEEPDIARRRERRRNTQRVRTPEDLEVVREVIEPELVQAEPAAWKQIGQEVSRRLDYHPGKFCWHETIRPKYVRVDDRSLPPLVSPATPQVIEGGLPAPGLLAQILVGRFCDHLPYYRQSDIFAQRHGVHIPRQQMVQWVAGSVRLLEGISQVLLGQLRQSPYVQVDETPIKYQDPGRPGRCSQGYAWTALVPDELVYYQWHTNRGARCLDELLGPDFTGDLQCDGYSAYPAYAARHPEVELAGCWAHVRRAIFEARQQDPRRAGILLQLIGQLYRWEKNCETPGPSSAEPAPAPCSNDCGASWKSTKAKFCPKACWAKRWPMPATNGPGWRSSWTPVIWRSTTTSSRTPSARRPWARTMRSCQLCGVGHLPEVVLGLFFVSE